MVRLASAGFVIALSTIAACCPVPRSSAGGLTAEQIQAIAPGTANCPGSDFPYECRTASQAAPYIEKSFQDYQITTVGEKAALLSLMLYESGEFKYNRNHWPGTPGQGTRNMQSPDFNLLYAKAILPADTVQQAQSQSVDAVLGLLRPDDKSFASAAWFLCSQCTPEIQSGLESGSRQGWEAYLTTCVGTTVDSKRAAYWTKAMEVLGG